MKYSDLTAVEDIDREKMIKITGGQTVGQFTSTVVHFWGEGIANLPPVKAAEAANDVTNHGQLIQVVADQFGLPGLNGSTALINTFGADVKLPPGLV